MPTSYDSVDLHARALAAAGALVERVTAADLHARTPCADWDLGQLLAHMIGQHRGFARAIAAGDADAAEFEPVEFAADELLPLWRDSVDRLLAAVAAAPTDGVVRLVEIDPQRGFGLPDVIAMQLLDTAVHTWDVATALRVPFRPDRDIEEQVARTAASVPAGEARDKSRAFAQPASADVSDRWLQTLAHLGRSVSSDGPGHPKRRTTPTQARTAHRQNVSSGAVWEPIVGYSRAVRVGSSVAVAGTTAAAEDGAVGGSDAGAQTREILSRIAHALEQVGASMTDVVRTRIFTTDISQWEAIGRAHGEVFGDIRPASAMLQVSSLIHPSLIVEIEADAIVGSEKN